MTKNKPTYQELNDELDAIIVIMQQEDTSIDDAVKQYQRGLELAAQLEERIKAGSNTIEELKATYKGDL